MSSDGNRRVSSALIRLGLCWALAMSGIGWRRIALMARRAPMLSSARAMATRTRKLGQPWWCSVWASVPDACAIQRPTPVAKAIPRMPPTA